MEQPGSVCVALPFGLHFWCMKPRNKLTLVQRCSRAEVVHVSGVEYLHFFTDHSTFSFVLTLKLSNTTNLKPKTSNFGALYISGALTFLKLTNVMVWITCRTIPSHVN